jgi:four helix bundle protein
MQDFRKLQVWQLARALTVFTYKATQAFPSSERFGLVLQMRKAAVSVGSNIAQGAGRGTQRDSKHFLQMSYGSASELLCQFLIAADLGYVSLEMLEEAGQQLGAVRGKLGGLMARLK